MRMTRIEQAVDETDFAQEAAEAFAGDPGMATYSDGDIEAGCLLAIRWGLRNDCVMVVRLDDAYDPTVYQQAIRKRQGEQHERKP